MVLNYDATWWMFGTFFNVENFSEAEFSKSKIIGVRVSPGQKLKKKKKNKPSQSFTNKTYINTLISHNIIVAPPCVKLHVEISPAVNP